MKMGWLKDQVKKYSVQGMTIATAVQATWMAMPATVQQYAPDWVTHTVVLAFLLYGLVGRFIPQGTANPPSA